MLTIAIDYDGTYTSDPETFDQVIKLLQLNHTVICVTGRSNDGVMNLEVDNSIGKLVPVVYAGVEWKMLAAFNKGYKVDIWIDDNPGSIIPLNFFRG